jgi:hypothetical protein
MQADRNPYVSNIITAPPASFTTSMVLMATAIAIAIFF